MAQRTGRGDGDKGLGEAGTGIVRGYGKGEKRPKNNNKTSIK